MLVNSNTIQTLNIGFSAIFAKAFAGVLSQKDKIATVVQSSTKTNEYAWLGSMPKMREWVGDKVIAELSAHKYTIHNKKWELTVGVSADDIEDDNIGIYNPMVQELGTEAVTHADDLVFKALEDGKKEKCYDGQYFFDDDHQVAGKSVSNVTTGDKALWVLLDTSRAIKPIIFQERKKPEFKRLNENSEIAFMQGKAIMGVEARYNVGYAFWQMAHASNGTLDEASFNKIRTGMRKVKSDTGSPLGIKPTVIVVHPDLEATAEKLFMTATLPNGGDNPLYKKVEVIVADKWA